MEGLEDLMVSIRLDDRRGVISAVIATAVLLSLSSMAFHRPASAAEPADPREIRKEQEKSPPNGVDREISLRHRELVESSGLAFSNRNKRYVWSHNDSGDRARLFAFDENGMASGVAELPRSVEATDWEDMASFVDGGKPRLIVADSGDNHAKRESITLYVFDEPDPSKNTKILDYQVLEVRYGSGAQDCEAIAVDARHRQIVLFTKSFLPKSDVFVVELPPLEIASGKVARQATAVWVTSLAVALATAADFDRDSGRVWLCNYFQGYCFEPAGDAKAARLIDTVRNLPQPVSLPAWKLIEAIAVDHEGRAWVTSEGQNTPLGRLPCLKSNRNSESPTEQP